MTRPQDRNKKYKFRKSSSGTEREYFTGKHKKALCAITKKVLHGVPHETKVGHAKKSATEKRPSAPFGGILSGEAREKVFIELGKVVAGIKQIDDVDQKYRKYVKQVMNRAEVE